MQNMYTNTVVRFLFGLTVLILFNACQGTQESKISINDEWRFIQIDELQNNDENFHKLNYDDSAWEIVSLPHTANVEPLQVNDQWQGTCWYRKSITVPEELADKNVFLELEAAMNQSSIWINGSLVNDHNGGYLPVVVDVSKYIKKGEANTIAIRLNNTDNAITGPKPLNILDFNMYGGLYRNAWLWVKDKVYISHPVLAGKTAGGGIFITTPVVSEDKASVAIKTHVINELTEAKHISVQHRIFFRGKLIKEFAVPQSIISGGKDKDFQAQIEIENPNLWSPNAPNLYTLTTKVFIEEQQVDEQVERFGIREFTFKNNQLYINGKKTFLRGVNRHQEYPFIGYALSDNAQYRDAKKIKEAGFDFVRLSHYPQSPAFMDACDELGLVVFDAILGWQYYLDSDLFREYCYRSARELILRDRNHPCVLAWEVSLNETQMPIFFMEELHRIVKREYPGENVYSCGWKNDVYDLYLQARQHRLQHYDSVQAKPYMVSEYGDWEYYSLNAGLNQHNYAKQLRYEMSSRQARGYGEKRLLQQAHNLQEAHNDNYNTPAFADGYWVMYDYNRGYDKDIEYSGVMDIFRIPKFSYYFYQSQRKPEQHTMVKVASYWTEESPLDVKVFSNCEEVELLLNGKSIARHKPDIGKNCENLEHPPFTFNLNKFEAGVLKAVGYINGQAVREDVVITPGEPVKLAITIDESGRAPEAGKNDVVFAYIQAVDANGTLVPNYTQAMELTIEGNAQIMNYDSKLITEAGIATALLRIGNEGDKISLTASSGNIKGELEVKVE